MAGLLHKPWPRNIRVRIKIANGTMFDVTDHVQRRGLRFKLNLDQSGAESTIPLEIDNQTPLGFYPEVWNEVFVDNPLPPGGGRYERYFRGFISEVTSEPGAGTHLYTLACVPPQKLLEKPPQIILGPLYWPAGTSDKTIIARILLESGLNAEMADQSNHIFDTVGPITIQNATPADALKQLQEQCPTGTEVPTFMVGWTLDDAAHTDPWSLEFYWYTSFNVLEGAIKLTDGPVESSNEAFYRGLTRSRRGLQLVNRQTVIGKDFTKGTPLTYTASDTESHDYIGRWIAGKPIIDDSLQTLAAVQARAELEVKRFRDVLETLSNIRTLVPYLANVQAGLRLQIKRDTEPGLDVYTTYALSSVELLWDAAGNPEHVITLGTDYNRFGEKGTGWRGGARFAKDTTPPQIPTWRNTAADFPINEYDPDTDTVTVRGDWIDNSELPDPDGDFWDYWVRYQIDGGNWHTLGDTTQQGYWDVPGLPPSTASHPHTIGFSVKARDTSGNASEWSDTRTATLTTRWPAQQPVNVTETGRGLDNQLYGWLALAWDDATATGAVTPVAWDVYYSQAGGIGAMQRVTQRSIVIHAIMLAVAVTVVIQPIDTYGFPGTASAPFVTTINHESPGPPATVTVTSTRTGPGLGQATVSWSAGTGGTGTVASYEGRYYPTLSGASAAQPFPAGSDLRVAVVPNLAVGVEYTFQVRSRTAMGDAGPWSTGTPHTIGAENPPPPSISVLDYDPGQTGPSGWISLGLTPGVGGTGTPATYNVRVDWTETSTGQARKIYRNSIPVSEPSVILSPLTAGPEYHITAWSVTANGDPSATPSTLDYVITPAMPPALYNGSFEVGDPTDKTKADGWDYSIGNGAVTFARDNTTSADGQWSQKVTATALGGGGQALGSLLSRNFLLQGGSPVVVYYSTRSSSTATDFLVSIYYYDRTGAYITDEDISDVLPGAANTWEKHSGASASAAPANAVSAQIRVQMAMNAVGVTAAVDGIIVRPLSLTVDYADASVTLAKIAAPVTTTDVQNTFTVGQVIALAANGVALHLQAAPGQGDNLVEVADDLGNDLFEVGPDGAMVLKAGIYVKKPSNVSLGHWDEWDGLWLANPDDIIQATIKARPGQTQRLLQFLNSAGGDLAYFTANGSLTVPNLTVTGAATLPANSVGSSQIQDGAVGASELATGSVNTAAFVAGAVDSTALADGSVIAAKLGTSAVTNTKIQNSAVNAAKLASDAVTTIKILDANVTQAKLATDSVGAAQIIDGSVGTNELANLAVTNGKLADNSVSKAKIGTDLVPLQKGTTNPAIASAADRNWRSDSATYRDTFYDGTRWDSTDVKVAEFINSAWTTAVSLSNSNVGRLAVAGDFAWLPVRFFAAFFVSGTNNASNYWILTLRYITAGNTVTNLATMDTSGKGPNNWDRIAQTTFLVATIPTTAFMLEIIATTSGSPGSLLVVPSLAFREIIP